MSSTKVDLILHLEDHLKTGVAGWTLFIWFLYDFVNASVPFHKEMRKQKKRWYCLNSINISIQELPLSSLLFYYWSSLWSVFRGWNGQRQSEARGCQWAECSSLRAPLLRSLDSTIMLHPFSIVCGYCSIRFLFVPSKTESKGVLGPLAESINIVLSHITSLISHHPQSQSNPSSSIITVVY